MIQKLSNKFRLIILDEKRRHVFLARIIYAALGLISFVMTILNILTNKQSLMISTAAFAVLSIVNLIFTFFGKKMVTLASVFFQIEMIVLLSFFIFSGTPEGFSAFWAALLPLGGMLLWGIKIGALDSFIMFLIIVFFCWTPFGRSLLQYDYTSSFLLRFPFLYTAFFLVSFLLSVVLVHVQNAYANQSKHDPLTKALNRSGLAEYMNSDFASGKTETVGFIIMDLDFFKNVNDTYGHQIGDKVLCHAVNLLSSVSPYKICRWGGEEFSIYCQDGAKVQTLAETIVKAFEKNDFVDGELVIHQTISAGGFITARNANISMNDLSRVADHNLYEAKNTGRNKAVVSHN